MEMDEALVSFDVTSLFTNVPTDEAVEVMHRKLMEEEDLVKKDPTITREDCRAPPALSEVHLLQLQW